MLTGALFAVRQGTPTAAQCDPSVSPQAPQMTTAALSASSSSSKPPSGSPAAQAASAQEIKEPQPASVTTSKTSENLLVTLRGPKAPGQSVYLSNRGNSIRQHQGILQEGFIQYGIDKYHDTDNPDGIINMGTSENKLCFDLLHRRVLQCSLICYFVFLSNTINIPSLITFEFFPLLQLTKPDMLYAEESLLQYSDWRGRRFLREEVAKFLSHYCRSPRPCLSLCLPCDGLINILLTYINTCVHALYVFFCVADAILIPTPFYGVITEDLGLYSEVKLFHVPLECETNGKESRPFHLTVEKLEQGLRRAKQEGLNVRAVILMNPHNPLAEIYTPQDMTAFLEFAKRNELHAIVDEVYMLTVFDESVTFHSVLGADRLPDPQRTHVMWGMSKDFAMSGIRIGTLYTENRDLVEALAQLGSFHGLPGTTQHQVAQLLKDRDWISEDFLPVNRRRLKAAHSYVTGELLSMGISYLNSPAAMYLWADFRKYLRESSFEEELSLWRCFLRHKVMLSCGQAFSCSTPGWFRIVFADQHHHLELDGIKNKKKQPPHTVPQG
uniref:1-aminocyclopropane-1-carboxylate synthase-like protein 1 n=1 Tax=Salarias fasciatus TaxID=181472 RepID=A0A672FTT9_SALFA